MSKTVLHVLSSRTYSGAENVVCQINRMLRKADSSFEIIYCSLDGPVRAHIEENNIKFIPVKSVTAGEIRRVINVVKPDLIHAHDMKAGLMAALACGKIPLISHIHNNNIDANGVSIKTLSFLYAALKAKHIFWVSKSSLDGYFFSKIVRKKSEVLYNVIDIDALYEKASQDKREYNYDVIYLGRLTYPKNTQRLTKVLLEAIRKMPDLKVAIVGEGEDMPEILDFVDEHGVGNNIDLLGFLSNPYKVLQCSKVMVMTSLWEGTPMCALEAQAFGKPIVSTPVDGLCDLIKNGENGFLSDDDEILSEKLVELASSPDEYARLSAAAKTSAVDRMNLKNYINRILSCYEEALGW